MINNPYIELVKNHEKILYKPDSIFARKNNWHSFFGNTNPLVLEIGTGLGNFFSKQVGENSEKNYIGMEIRYKRLFQTAEKCLGRKGTYSDNISHKTQEANISNNFVLLKEYGEKVGEIFGPGELKECYIFFPDPWARKKSQLKNRLLQTDFLANLYNIMSDNAKVVIKTDHREYFNFLLGELEKTDWKTTYKSYDFENEPEFKNSETTEFQQLFRGQDIKINHIELGK